MTSERYLNSRGVSLVESLVALAIIGFGLLGLIRLQLHLVRTTGDAAHRVEAVRLAQHKLEEMRSLPNGEAIGSGQDTAKNIGNSVYTRSWTVTGNAGDFQRLATVTVRWTDASQSEGNTPSVVLSTAMPIADPGDVGQLMLPAAGGFVRLVSRRHASIPPSAVALKGANKGRSVLKDPSAENVFLVIDDASGFVIARCNFRPHDSTSIQSECDLQGEALLRGYIVSAESSDAAALRISNTGSAQATGWSRCEVVRATAAEGRPIANTYRYQCRIATTADAGSPSAAPTWKGRLAFLSLSVGISACRYADGGAPGSYTEVASSLDNQNFLLTAEHTCPEGTVLQPST